MSKRRQSAGTSGKNCDVGVNEKDLRLPMLKLKCKVSVEDDINQIFEDISIRTSKKSLDSLHEIGASPVRRNPLKKPITSGTPRSSGFGSTEAVSLKQALRELSISKASEAASRRLSRSSASPRVSESGKMKNMHNAVAGKDCPSSSRSKYGFMEVSAVPEKGKPNVSERLPDHFRIPKYKLLSQSCNSSPKFTMATPHDGAGTSLVRNETHFSSREVTSQTYKQERVPKNKLSRSPSVSSAQINHSIDEVRQSAVKASLSPKERIIIPYEESAYPVQALKLNSLNSNAQTASGFGVGIEPASSTPTVIKNNVSSALESVESKHDPHYSSSIGVPIIQNNIVYPLEDVGSLRSDHSTSKLYVATKQNPPPVVMEENESVSSSALTDIDITDQAKVGKHTSAFSTIYSSENGGNIVDRGGNDATLSRMPENALQQMLQQAGSFQPTAYASGNGNRVSKLPRGSNSSAKPVTKYMIVIKKKVKWLPTVRSVAGKDAKTNRSVDHTSQLVCQRCNCVLNLNKGSNQRSIVSTFSGSKAEVSSTRINPGLSTPHFNLKSYKTVVERKDFKSKGKGEFSQSSGSIGEYCSTSTSMDYDSNASSSTCQNKPHMSKDVRWAAIRNAKMQQGNLDLGHFNLLKKLGRGDIGTVYLSELIGSNCFFAIKVMDNEFLARRKKMLRARIERDILSMLDHPFLPTLYAQFTSNNMSCLVMEYCPGGDLHVLRQKQSNKRFSETAARFYVAEVLLALEYLHMLGIVYRDLKPENVLVREDGHIMLTDFDLSLTCDVSPSLLQSSSADMDPARMSGPCASSGCIAPFCSEQSCQMSCFRPRFLPVTAKSKKSKANLTGKVGALPQLVAEPTEARSNSFVGTHEYLAPEIIRSEGHGAAVDWWTLGVFLYELLYGKTPFKGSGNKDTLANAVLRGLKFPSIPFVSSQARDLIRGLLVKDPEHRLGSVKGAAEIKQHPFFRGLNWALIRCAVPPGLPESYGLGSRYGS